MASVLWAESKGADEMAYRCDICGKSKLYGHNVSFSQRKTNRVWKPNLQTKPLVVGTNRVKLKVCTQCLRRLKAEEANAVSEEKPKAAAKS